MADGSVLVLSGSPVDLDAALRRAARLVQAVVGVPATLALWWFEAWWWLPIPMVVSFVVYELLFWSRGDRPTTLRLTEVGVELVDTLRRQTLSVPWAEVEVATATWQRARYGSEVVVLLADARGPRIAVRFLVPTSPAPGVGDVDLDAADHVLGGQAGVIRSVAPFEVGARQRFEDPRGLAFVRRMSPPAAWGRTGLRVWTGEAPPLDPFGYHLGEPDGWLVLEGSRWVLRRWGTTEELASGVLDTLHAHRALRVCPIVLRAGDAPVDAEIPLLALALTDTLRVYMPAPEGAPHAEPRAPTASDHHTHPPEGAALVWHILRNVPSAGWPVPLRDAVAASGVPATRLPAA